MDGYEYIFSLNNAPLFDGTYYENWHFRMRVFLQEQGYDICESILKGYIAPKMRAKATTKKELRENNAMKMATIVHGLSNSMKDKVRKFTLAKKNWHKF